MIVQAIALLDDLDKEINIYSMRVKEWYGWHFPEMAKIISENITYAKVVKAMGAFPSPCRSVFLLTRWLRRLPDKLLDDGLLRDPPRRARGDAQGGRRHLDGNRDLGL